MDAYVRPERLSDALEALRRGPATVAAGCTDLFAATERPALPGVVVDLTGIAELRGIGLGKGPDAGYYTIGATATWTDLINAPLPPAFDMLKQAAREVGSTQIQNAATVVGNICNASPAADGVPGLLALRAEVTLASDRGARHLPLADFITGPRQTALAQGEIVTGLRIPRAQALGRSRFLKLGARRHLVISIVMVAARLAVEGGKISDAALAVGACSPVACRLPSLEAALIGQKATADLASLIEPGAIARSLSPIADLRADAAYRGHAAAELLRRAVWDVLDEEPAK